jgi:NADP-dependent 3-hydroxy acid dehydrogenase YdfG
VNNAGTNKRRPFHLMTFDEFWRVIDVNFKAVPPQLVTLLMIAYVSDA